MKAEKDLRLRTKMLARRIIGLYVALPKMDAVAQISKHSRGIT